MQTAQPSIRSRLVVAAGLGGLFLELLAGVIAGAVVTFTHARDIGRTDEEMLGLVAFAVFGGALLGVPIGALRGRRRRRRWIEAVVLQSTLVFISIIALATSKHALVAVWPFLVSVTVLVLLLAAPVSPDVAAELS